MWQPAPGHCAPFWLWTGFCVWLHASYGLHNIWGHSHIISVLCGFYECHVLAAFLLFLLSWTFLTRMKAASRLSVQFKMHADAVIPFRSGAHTPRMVCTHMITDRWIMKCLGFGVTSFSVSLDHIIECLVLEHNSLSWVSVISWINSIGRRTSMSLLSQRGCPRVVT